MAAQVANGLVDKIQDSDIEIELDVAALNAGSYEEIQVSEEAWYAYPNYGELSEEEEILELQTDNLLTATFANAIHLDYMGEEIDESNFDQALETLTTDLNTAMDGLGLTDQLGRELVEEEVMTYFRDIWLKTIANDDDDDLFAMHFDYTQSNTLLNANGNYNGNISQLTWRVRGRDKAVYGFQYDELDRIEQAKYTEQDDAYVHYNTDNYNVENISYDFNGNIKTLDRKGNTNTVSNPVFGWIDQMTYTYDGNSPNQLTGVSDASIATVGFKDGNSGTDYTYDANGNLTEDQNKDIINITYNHQNLPKQIDFQNGDVIEWTYDAAGVKLTKVAESNTGVVTVHYVGGIEYIETSTNTYELSAVYHSEGRLTEEGQKSGRFDYEYSLKDHLGNTRVIFCDLDNNGVISLDPNDEEIIQENHYYPFGSSMVGDGTWYSISGSENFYQYNGKELNTDFGLNWHSYGFRMYDAALGRFPSIDPIADQFAFVSPYNYAENTPIMAIDLHGLQKVMINDIKEGDKIIKRKVNVIVNQKVLNLSSYDDYLLSIGESNAESMDMVSFNTTFSDRIMPIGTKIFTKYKVPIEINFSLQMNFIDNIDKVKDTDYVMVIVDKIKDGKGNDLLGVARGGGNYNMVEASVMKKKSNTPLHELGHNLGLDFWEEGDEKHARTEHTKDGKGLMGATSKNQYGVSDKALAEMYYSNLAVYIGKSHHTFIYENTQKNVKSFFKENVESYDTKKVEKAGF